MEHVLVRGPILMPLTVAAQNNIAGGAAPRILTLDPQVYILPIFQILYGPYGPYITNILDIIWTTVHI